MSALTIGLVAATMVSLASYRIRHSNLASRKASAGTPAPAPPETTPKKQTVIVSPGQDMEDKLILFLTALFSITALFIIFSPQYGEIEQRLAAGVIGTVIGFWCKVTWKP